MPDAFDLDAYLTRITYTGDRAPTLDTLGGVVLGHAQAIPFENLDPLLRRPVPLDVEALQAKMVRGRRGGWCFEQNHLLRHALDALGFRTTALVARVLWNASVTAGGVTSRSHMLILVHLDEPGDGPYVVDVGFGGLTLTAPLRLVPNVEQSTPHEPFRLVPHDERELRLEALVAGDWKPLYRFDMQPQHTLDYEIASWYLCTNPRSSFLANLMVGRAEPRGRRVLRNNVLTTHRVGAPSESRRLTTAAELREALETTFDLDLPDSPELEPTLERIAATTSTPP
jgi:N-hydroxyarylamine O-acetyltransferase